MPKDDATLSAASVGSPTPPGGRPTPRILTMPTVRRVAEPPIFPGKPKKRFFLDLGLPSVRR